MSAMELSLRRNLEVLFGISFAQQSAKRQAASDLAMSRAINCSDDYIAASWALCERFNGIAFDFEYVDTKTDCPVCDGPCKEGKDGAPLGPFDCTQCGLHEEICICPIDGDTTKPKCNVCGEDDNMCLCLLVEYPTEEFEPDCMLDSYYPFPHIPEAHNYA
jgi:hypothetical protein